MTNILGIDWGKSKVGLAWSAGIISEPLEVIRYSNQTSLIEKIKQIVVDMEIKKIVIGISEGVSADLTKQFGSALGSALDLPIIYFDETLSSRDAQMYSIQANIKRKKRKTLEDAYAASLMLQHYLDMSA